MASSSPKQVFGIVSQTWVFKFHLYYTADAKTFFWISLHDQISVKNGQVRVACEGQKRLTIVLAAFLFFVKLACSGFCNL